MIHTSSQNDLPMVLEPAEPLLIAKSSQLSLDFSDLLSTKTPQTPSNLSIYESGSIKADDEGRKSFGLEIMSMKSLTSETLSSIEMDVFDQKMTIGEIISKRSYTRKAKTPKNTCTGSEIMGRKRRKQGNAEDDIEEKIIKKEKREKEVIKKVIVPAREIPAVPELVFVNGKLEVCLEKSTQNIEEERKLEIVKPDKKKVTTSNSFKKVVHTEKWTEKETTKFFRALQIFGTDFSMIAKVFPSRNRNQIKNKFLREEKQSPEKVNKSLKAPIATNFQNIFRKFEKIKKSQKTPPALTSEKNEAESSLTSNLLLPSQRPHKEPESKQEDLQIIKQDRNERSGSFHSTTSIDSVDQAIMEDLSDILLPQKSLFGF